MAGAPPRGADGPSGLAMLVHYALALAVLVTIGVATVWQHTRTVRAGYRMGALERERQALREQERKLELLRLEESALEPLLDRARTLRLEIPGE